MRSMPFMLFPAVALVAQAPVSPNLAQSFNAELPGINQLMKELKPKEALAKAEALVPAQKPTINTTDLNTLLAGSDNLRGLVKIYRLCANAAGETGDWEKALEFAKKAEGVAKENLGTYKAEAVKKADEVVNTLVSNQGQFKAQWDPMRKTMMDKPTRTPEEEAAIKSNDDKGALFERYIKAARNNRATVDEVVKDLGKDVSETGGQAATLAEKIKVQNEEITQFNTQQTIKKVKVVGKKNWVDAVLRNQENVTKLGTPQVQAAFLSRMLVLDPGNAGAQKALDNLKAGKEAFAKEAKPAKSTKKKK